MHERIIVNKIVCGIRQGIARGTWPRSSLLPTRAELARIFDTSPSTMQVAIGVLTSEGSLITRKRGGTAIVEKPPECGRFALVMSDHGPQPKDSSHLFHEQLLDAVANVSKCYPGWQMQAWSPADPELEALIRVGALDGIFYIGTPHKIPDTTGTGIPLACYHYPGAPWYGDVNLSISKQSFFETCVRALRRAKQTRIGVLDNGGGISSETAAKSLGEHFSDIRNVINSGGGDCPPAWIQHCYPIAPLSAYHATLLLLRHPFDRPQALILVDDHFLPPVLEAIRDLGLKIPTDIAICVTGYNDGRESGDQCMRVGFSVEPLLHEILRQLELLRRGTIVAKELVWPYTDFSDPESPPPANPAVT